MKFFNFLKKKIETAKTPEQTCLSIQELKDKINKLLDENEDINPFRNNVNELTQNLNQIKECIDALSTKKEEGDFSKALVVGVNNIRRALCGTINSTIITRTPKTLTEFNEYLNDINKLIMNSHASLTKYSNAVNFVYKNEMEALIENLDNLSEKFNKNTSEIQERVILINSFNLIQTLIKEYVELINDETALRKNLEINNQNIDSIKTVINEASQKLEQLENSEELRKALKNESRINELKSEISTITYKADMIISLLSKTLKRFTHEASNSFIDSMIKEPLKTISESENEFNKLKESLLKELNNGNIELKDKQETKTRQSLESNELIQLAKEHASLNSEIKKLDTTSLDTRAELNENINKLVRQEESINNENKEINEKINTLINKKKDLLERLAGKTSMTLNQKIIISP